jgi:hypothetical protein
MTRFKPAACLLLAALLGGCSTAPSVDTQRDADGAANLAAAQALAATAPPEDQPLSPWLKAERARIEAARSDANQRFENEEKTCWRRFAVNACVRDARAQRRAVLDRLRQEDLAINQLERKRLADARLRQIGQKQPGAQP